MHRYTLRVRPYECDVYGHVNIAVYLNYLETSRDMLLLDNGLDYRSLVASKIGIWVVESHLFYRSPAQMGETLEIESTVGDLGASSVELVQVVRGPDGRTVAEGRIRLVWVNESGRPTRIPPDWKAVFSTPT